jgi:hypothetical protein
MPALYSASYDQFVHTSANEIVGILSVGYAAQGFSDQRTDQTESWASDIKRLQSALSHAASLCPAIIHWVVILEFAIPRKGKRIDAILLTPDVIVVLEFKAGDATAHATRQVEEYALLLHYFHKPSSHRRILPFVIAPSAAATPTSHFEQRELGFPELASTWIAPVATCDWTRSVEQLRRIAESNHGTVPVAAEEWINGAYYPVPTIIDAALALRSGLAIREIAHSEASEHEIGAVTETIQNLVTQAQGRREFTICFLTGVPGSGKTLVGLGLAHSRQNNERAIHFMSGNGPLVKVLQHLFTQQAMSEKIPAPEARIRARTLIENVHLFAKHYADDAPAEIPSNNVIIFDEAQRAWNRRQNLRKFARNYSEPEMLLSIMERHTDWACVVALVGGGQEINDGEAGLEEWGRALQQSSKPWRVFASPEVLHGGESTAGHRLFEESDDRAAFSPVPQLHLRTSNRSLRAENLARWVNAVIAGDAPAARSFNVCDKFPLYLTRNLDTLKQTLKRECLGESRYGLAASSGASRLRAEGLEPDSTFHASYPWEHWYLAGKADVRSSFQCEVFATEFEIQGLELDWIGLCWGGDFVWQSPSGWSARKFRPGSSSKWSPITNPEKCRFRENAYRVLLTRARQGLVIFVPAGAQDDPTRSPADFDATARFLEDCGVRSIDAPKLQKPSMPVSPAIPSLFDGE